MYVKYFGFVLFKTTNKITIQILLVKFEKCSPSIYLKKCVI